MSLSLIFRLAQFFLKHWKTFAAIGFLVVAGAEGYRLRTKEDERAQAMSEVRTLKARLATVTLQQALDAQRARKDRDTLETLQRIARETPPNNAACLDRAAVGRVRSIH